jgi:bifunctional UDP-N-acetylglucosamine pyrophosphorylase/glucosamine-1-phosphate N-acetyltransferase
LDGGSPLWQIAPPASPLDDEPPPHAMSRHNVAAIILAAGKGTRMKSALPKVLHQVAGRAMVLHVLDAVGSLGASRAVVVIGPDMQEVAAAVAPADTAVQAQQLGTADAVKAARGALGDFRGTVFILFGDTPLIAPATLQAMVAARAKPAAPAIVVLGFRPADPGAYGRLVLGPDGTLRAIVEAKDATAQQRRIRLCNSGVMAVDGAILFDLLDQVDNKNAKGEFYLTDIVGLARKRRLKAAHIEAPEAELLGVNDRNDLARAEAALQARLRRAAMTGGATMTDPESVFLAWDTRIGNDVTIGPNVVFGPGAVVLNGAEIRAFSHIEGAEIGPGAVVGPFARLRPGTRLGAGVHIGNFVEAKNAHLGAGAKANHLTYLGDAEIGAKVNVGAGTITCNYDGFLKSKTIIKDGAFIGSNTALVAPVTVGERAIIGAGSTIARDVASDAIAVTRAEHREIPGGAERYRIKKRAEKAARGKSKDD